MGSVGIKQRLIVRENVRDLQGDIFLPSALKAADGLEVPIRMNFDGDAIGRGNFEYAEGEGLRFRGLLIGPSEDAQAVLEAGGRVVVGLTCEAEQWDEDGKTRTIRRAKIREASITLHPVDPDLPAPEISEGHS